MNLDQFIQQRRSSWQELEQLLEKTKRNAKVLTQAEMQQLRLLYRSATSDLALPQHDFPQQKVATYLNQLVARAHVQIYRGESFQFHWLKGYFTHIFPRLYRTLLPYTILAPDPVYVILGEEIRIVEPRLKEGELWTEISPAVRSTASARIMTNNIQVTFLAFSVGMTAGLLTIWVMILNGLNLGATFAWLQPFGLSLGLGEFVLVHGFIELSVIFVAGGCGLYLGDGIIRPGLLTRQEALVQRSRQSVLLILGCALVLVVSGLIEGFISPSGLPWIVKLAVGLGTGILLHYYWLRIGLANKQDELS